MQDTQPDIPTISAADFVALVRNGSPLILDVRSFDQIRRIRVDGACHAERRWLTSENVRAFLEENGVADQPIYVLCDGVDGATRAAQCLRRMDISRLVIVEGGLGGGIAAVPGSDDILLFDTPVPRQQIVCLPPPREKSLGEPGLG